MAATLEPDGRERAQPYTFDVGHLLCIDTNPLPSTSTKPDTREATLQATAQGCAQALISQLLTVCPIVRSSDGDLQIKLPEPETRLPREKPVPKEKEQTKWEKFAAKKGIKAKKRDGKLTYDEAKGDWVPKYGYKGKDDGADWLVEVDEKAERKREAEGASEGAGKGARKFKKSR